MTPRGGYAALLFRDTRPQGLDTTMRALGAHPKINPIPWPSWLFPQTTQPLLDFDLIEDVAAYAIDLHVTSWEWFIPLFDALKVKEKNSLLLCVDVRDEPSAPNALREFVLKLLEKHPGVVRDSRTGEVWTRDDIASNSIRRGLIFFGLGGALASGTDTG